MPLRDHFRPPVSTRVSWEEIHGMWPARIVLQLRTVLPAGYVAGPKIHAGSQVEIDVATFEHDDALPPPSAADDSGVATTLWAPPEPTVAVETEPPDYDEYEVRIYDAERGRRLVAAVELVSPGNKDRPEKRNAFVGKCAALLQKGVAVSIVDVVTPRQFNLYAELLQFLGQTDPTLGEPQPHLYAVSCRWRPQDQRMLLQTWSHALALGQPLPTLPLWLTEKRAVPLDLEQSYEQACHDLWLT
ncbi:MAG: DUF4058 family protein [Planctomycetia bacterium]|nr:DUF4058 family protein [Planctomycetia bacterium]